jgi:hypothetical protein
LLREDENGSENTFLQLLLQKRSAVEIYGVWFCNKFDDYNLIKYKEFKFEQIFIFPRDFYHFVE